MTDQERRRLLRKARKEGWDDEKRAAAGLGPSRPRAGGEKEKPAPKGQKQYHPVNNANHHDDADVVELFGTDRTPSVNKGDLVPPSGVPDYTVDPRKRKRLKFSRLGKRWSEITEAVKTGEYTWEEFTETLSPEELARGQLKDKHGGFLGRPPSFVPRAFHDACVRELLSRGKVLYKENYIACIHAMTEIAGDPAAKEGDRIKAAQFVIERLEGKVPDRLEIAAADPWQSIISGIVAEVEDDQIARAQDYLNRREEIANGNETS